MNYYSENDPKAAAWLRELIKENLISPGEVDERSIRDVQPEDLWEYDQVHLFAGIGGWSYALRLAGIPDDFPLWTGSCPCQPFSGAGKRLGTADARHLWPEMRRLIAACHPSTVIGEQVASKDGRKWLAGVHTDLEALGFDFGAADLCAAGVNAPHLRQRIYWVAHSQRASNELDWEAGHPSCAGGRIEANEEEREWSGAPSSDHGTTGEPHTGSMAQSESIQHNRSRNEGRGRRESTDGSVLGQSHLSGLGNATSGRNREAQNDGGQAEINGARRIGGTGGPGAIGGVGNTQSQRESSIAGSAREGILFTNGANFWSNYDIAICDDLDKEGRRKARRIESGTFPLVDGLPHRVGLLRGYGNAINPILAEVFIRAAFEAINLG